VRALIAAFSRCPTRNSLSEFLSGAMAGNTII
jgi:hypothetical protein